MEWGVREPHYGPALVLKKIEILAVAHGKIPNSQNFMDASSANPRTIIIRQTYCQKTISGFGFNFHKPSL